MRREHAPPREGAALSIGGIPRGDLRVTADVPDFVRLPVEELHFDPDNPRLPASVDGSDEQAVLDWMLQDAGLVELMGSIAVNGYFTAEPNTRYAGRER